MQEYMITREQMLAHKSRFVCMIKVTKKVETTVLEDGQNLSWFDLGLWIVVRFKSSAPCNLCVFLVEYPLLLLW